MSACRPVWTHCRHRTTQRLRNQDAGTGALTLVTEDGIEHYLLYEVEGFYTINGRRVRTCVALAIAESAINAVAIIGYASHLF